MPVSVEEALHRIRATVSPLAAEEVALGRAGGRICAGDLPARWPHPAFTQSAMDGYALRSVDSDSELVVKGVQAAGSPVSELIVGPGTAVRIFTGAPLPPGADAVLIQENAERDGDVLRALAPVAPFANVRRAGEDVAEGDIFLRTGDRIDSGAIASLATQGYTEVPVVRLSRVVVTSSGDELVAAGRRPGPGWVVNSNLPMLAYAVSSSGALVCERGPIADNDADTLAALKDAAADADLVIVAGGMSVGDRDRVGKVLHSAGEIHFHGVAMKPGKPVAFASLDGTPVLGLPGNPVSAWVGFELFGREILRCLSGRGSVQRFSMKLPLASAVPRNRRRVEFVRGTVDEQGFHAFAEQGSGALSSLVGVGALARIEPGEGTALRGDLVPVLDLRGSYP